MIARRAKTHLLDADAAHCRVAEQGDNRYRANRRSICTLRGAGKRHRVGQRGTVLPIVLLIAAMMLATSAAWFESSLAAARGGTNVRDYLQAFHAADSALMSCVAAVVAADGPGSLQGTGDPATIPSTSAEPAQWKIQAVFEAGAIAPVSPWPGSLRPPQCLIEAWRLATRPDATAYLITSRGFGRNQEAQVWLQMELAFDGGRIERRWRRIVSRPF